MFASGQILRFPRAGWAVWMLLLGTGGSLYLFRSCEVGRRLPLLSIRDAGPVHHPHEVLDLPHRNGMVLLPSGAGSARSSQAAITPRGAEQERPVASFWLDVNEVTNRQFSLFVEATGYRTAAERRGWSHVFLPAAGRWEKVPRADWRHPLGPNSSIAGGDDWPVVQVSWSDAAAFAQWAGKRLPSETEWEYAARGGLYDAPYPWGREEKLAGMCQANYWQGWFPEEDLGTDGYRYLAPVAAFRPNRFGLYDMAGNVWEWCAAAPARAHTNAGHGTLRVTASAPGETEERVQRGGSWLCSENSAGGIEVWRRLISPAAAASNQTGFRCARDSEE